MLVVGELDAARFEVGEAVEDVAAVEIGPARHGAREEAAVAGRSGEIEDFLPRRRRSCGPITSGNSFGSHGPAANTNRSAFTRIAGGKLDLLQSLAAGLTAVERSLSR